MIQTEKKQLKVIFLHYLNTLIANVIIIVFQIFMLKNLPSYSNISIPTNVYKNCMFEANYYFCINFLTTASMLTTDSFLDAIRHIN